MDSGNWSKANMVPDYTSEEGSCSAISALLTS